MINQIIKQFATINNVKSSKISPLGSVRVQWQDESLYSAGQSVPPQFAKISGSTEVFEGTNSISLLNINKESVGLKLNKKESIVEIKEQFKVIDTVLKAYFNHFYVLISKPVYSYTKEGIKISLFYFEQNNLSRSVKTISHAKSRLTKIHKLIMASTEFSTIESKITEKQLSSDFKIKLPSLIKLISKVLGTNVQIEIVGLKYVYHDTTILSQFLGLNSNILTFGRLKKLLFRKIWVQSALQRHLVLQKRMRDKVLNATLPFKKTNETFFVDSNGYGNISSSSDPMDHNPSTMRAKALETLLTGFKVRIGGRLARQRIIPKNTVKTTYKGAISPRKMNLVDQASFTGKNKKGAFSIKVWLSHGY